VRLNDGDWANAFITAYCMPQWHCGRRTAVHDALMHASEAYYRLATAQRSSLSVFLGVNCVRNISEHTEATHRPAFIGRCIQIILKRNTTARASDATLTGPVAPNAGYLAPLRATNYRSGGVVVPVA
jgi:hypothetical protein